MTPAHELAAGLGAAWIPAFAGMTTREARRVYLRLALDHFSRTALRLHGDDEIERQEDWLTADG